MDFNEPDSKYYDPDRYYSIVTNAQEMEQFRGIICQNQVCSPTYPFSVYPKNNKSVWTFTVFHGPYK